MNILEKLYNENKERATHYYNLNLKDLTELYEKYSHIDFGSYNVALVAFDQISVKVSEKGFNKAISFFRKQFDKKGEIKVSSYGSSFGVSYVFDKDFSVFFYTDDPTKYLKEGCEIKKKQCTLYEISCDLR